MSTNAVGAIGFLVVLISCSAVAAAMATDYKEAVKPVRAKSESESEGEDGGDNCTYDEWSEWSRCRNGKRERTRSVVSKEGAVCGPDVETRPCACVGVWEDDEHGCRCGYATKKQTFRRLTPAVTQSTCVARDGQVRFVSCQQPSECPSPTENHPSPPVTPPSPIRNITIPDCIGNWEDDLVGCPCGSTTKRQLFKVLRRAKYGGEFCPTEKTRTVACRPSSSCPESN